MKFTEGNWERNERANMVYAVQAFQIEEIPGGIRIVAPTKSIKSRSDALDTATLTTEITSAGENILEVRSYHFEGYKKRRCDLKSRYNLLIYALVKTRRE